MPAPFDKTTILASFADEVREYLPRLAERIRELAAQPDGVDADLLEECHRYAHTIKSASGMIGCMPLADVARPLEEAFVAVGDGSMVISRETTATFERCVERLAKLLNSLPLDQDTTTIVAENTADFAALYPDPRDDASADTSTGEAGPFWTGWAEHSETLGEPVPVADDEPAVEVQVASPATPPLDLDSVPSQPPPSTPRPPVTVEELLAWLPIESPAAEEDGRAVDDGAVEPAFVDSAVTAEPEALEAPMTGETTPILLHIEPAPSTEPAVTLDLQPATEDHGPDELQPALEIANTSSIAPLEPIGDRESNAPAAYHAAVPDSAFPSRAPVNEPASDGAVVASRSNWGEVVATGVIPPEVYAVLRSELETTLRQEIEAEVRERVESEYRSALEEQLWTSVQSLGSRGAVVYTAERGPTELAQSREMLDVFVEEAADHLRQIELALPRLTSHPPDHAAARSIRQAVHTLKGAAGMVGQHQISRLAHLLEDVLDRALAPDVRLDESPIDLIADACGALDSLVRSDPDAQLDTETIASIWKRLANASESNVTPLVDEELDEHMLAPLPEDSAHAQTQTLRVPADRLDRVIEVLAQMASSRSALESRVARLDALGNELALASSRLDRASRALQSRPGTLERLAHEVIESAADVAAAASEIAGAIHDTQSATAQQQRLARRLQDDVFALRQVPFSQVTSRLYWALRRLASTEGKRIDLVVEGADVDLDRATLDGLADPLLHLVRNAVTHGIERPERRLAAGKPATGRVTLGARVESGQIIVQVTDDGAGIDEQAVREAAVHRGLLRPEHVHMAADGMQLAFLPGVSTQSNVSEASGRGIGLDAVRTTVAQRGGTIAVESSPGRGTTFSLRLPQTVAITRSLVVEAGGQHFAIPLQSVRYVARHHDEAFGRARLQNRRDDSRVWVQLGSERVRIENLAELLQLSADEAGRPYHSTAIPLIIAGSRDNRLAIAVDRVVGEREIVVKPLPWPAAQRSVAIGVALVEGLTTGPRSGEDPSTVVLVLDVGQLGQLRHTQVTPTLISSTRQRGRVLVVDDSLTVRRAVRTVLEEDGWHVDTARDGAEALSVIGDRQPDLAIVDVEMPHIDGFQLVAILRRQPATRSLPVVILTSRSEPEYRAQAGRLGVDRYLLKPHHPTELLNTVRELAFSPRSS